MTNETRATGPLPGDEFRAIYSKVPRLTVDIVLQDTAGAAHLTKRAIPPCQGQWHLPGGTVRFGEPLLGAVRRIAQRELNIDVHAATGLGKFEICMARAECPARAGHLAHALAGMHGETEANSSRLMAEVTGYGNWEGTEDIWLRAVTVRC